MRRNFIFCVVILALACGSLLARGPQQPQQPLQQNQAPPAAAKPAQATPPSQSIVSNVRLVDILFSVVNHRQRYVTDLDQADFKVTEDNHPQQIRFFSRQTDLPLRIALLLDTSNSIRERLTFEQDAAVNFLYNVMRPDRDQAFLMTFDAEPEVILDYTNDMDKLRDTIQAQRAGGGTALYEAIIKASDKLAKAPLTKNTDPDVRRILVVISDGEDNLSGHTRVDAIESAQRAGTVMYPVSTSTEWVSPDQSNDMAKRMDRKVMKNEGDKVLDAFANETGGRAFFPYHVDDVAQSFLDIGTELRSQYSLAYIPTNGISDGKYRKIRIELVNRKGLEVRTRTGYFATPPIMITPTGERIPGQGQY